MIPKASPQYRSDALRTIENNAPETQIFIIAESRTTSQLSCMVSISHHRRWLVINKVDHKDPVRLSKPLDDAVRIIGNRVRTVINE